MWRDKSHQYFRALGVLSLRDKQKIYAATIFQILMGGLDLLGVIAIGLLGAISVGGLQSSAPGENVGKALEFLRIQNLDFQSQATILALGAVLLLISRTILSIFFTRRILFFLSRRGAKISSDLISRLLSQPMLFVQSRTTQEIVYSVTSGVERVVLQVLATSVVWISDFAMLIVMFIGLILVDPLTAVSSFAVFLIVGLFMHRFMNSRAGLLGVKNANLNISSNEKIVEVFASYRESVVRNRRDYYAREIGKLRYQLADTSAEMGFLPYVSKYVIETSVVIGAVMIGSIQFLQQNASHAIATISIFLAAGSRIAPAVLRLQQGSITINTGLGVATPTLDLIESLDNVPLSISVNDAVDFIHEGFNPEILIQDVNFKYPNAPRNAISNINLKISPGSSLAVIGPSGAGKTTLIDVLLGVLHPDSGSIRISGLQPSESISRWPGGISYVPQDIMISAGTIRENVALGYPLESVTSEAVLNALKVANLEDFVNSLPDGIETVVGERGARLSGGQRQRLGIARAMFTRPYLLVLDEATSSLDGETEAGISKSIQALHGATTVVVIAHRLSTVKNADLVVYLSEGEIIAKGRFEEVKNKIVDFDNRAKMLGI